MAGRNREAKQLNKKYAELLFYLSLLAIAVFGFLFLGESGYYLIDDSESYMNLASGMEGVMPVYPLFLHGNKILFGEGGYLYAVIVEQSVFAAVCVVIFIRTVKNKFRLNYAESFICFLLALMTFTGDMPETMVPREILTEGLAYAAFYLFMAALLQAVWNKNWKWYGILCITTLFLAAVRSQLQILFGVCGIAFLYIVVCRRKKGEKGKILLRLLAGMAGCLATGLIGIWVTMQFAGMYRTVSERAQEQKEQTAQSVQEEQIIQEEQALQREPESLDGTEDSGAGVQKEEPAKLEAQMDIEEQSSGDEPKQMQGFTTSQYVTLIFNKGMYEADYEDYQLFENEQVRELFLRLYEKIDSEQYRYEYATPGLWMWRNIMDTALIGVVCLQEQNDFYLEEYPELLYDTSYSSVRNHNQIEIGLTLIKAHWGRFFYHMLMLLPQAFVSTVFFQMKRIYLLCHVITLFLYLSAAALTIWAYKSKKVQNAYGEFMAAVLGTNIVMVVIISIVFFGQKRYLFYNFGIFYIAYFLLVLQVWKHYVRDFVMEKIKNSGVGKRAKK